MVKSDYDWQEDELSTKDAEFTVKSLQLMNGGGVVVLFAFLGQTWDSVPDLRAPILISIVLMTAGLSLVTLSAILRLRGLNLPRKGRRLSEQSIWKRVLYTNRLYVPLRHSAFVVFIVSCILLVVRAFSIV